MQTVPPSDARDVEIANQGDVALLTVYVEQDEMGGCQEIIQQQPNKVEGENVSNFWNHSLIFYNYLMECKWVASQTIVFDYIHILFSF